MQIETKSLFSVLGIEKLDDRFSVIHAGAKDIEEFEASLAEVDEQLRQSRKMGAVGWALALKGEA